MRTETHNMLVTRHATMFEIIIAMNLVFKCASTQDHGKANLWFNHAVIKRLINYYRLCER